MAEQPQNQVRAQSVINSYRQMLAEANEQLAIARGQIQDLQDQITEMVKTQDQDDETGT